METPKTPPICQLLKRLAQARQSVYGLNLKPRINEFTGLKYYELSDILPHLVAALFEVDLIAYVAFDQKMAVLHVVDTETAIEVAVVCPMPRATLRNHNPIESMQAIQQAVSAQLYTNLFAL